MQISMFTWLFLYTVQDAQYKCIKPEAPIGVNKHKNGHMST